MSEVIEQRTSSTEIIWAIARLLSAFGDRSKTIDLPNLYHGVSVLQNADEPDVHRFTFRTPDELEMIIEVDFRALSHEYIDDLIARVRRDLALARQVRDGAQEQEIAKALRETLH